jgi:hypothetical protein
MWHLHNITPWSSCPLYQNLKAAALKPAIFHWPRRQSPFALLLPQNLSNLSQLPRYHNGPLLSKQDRNKPATLRPIGFAFGTNSSNHIRPPYLLDPVCSSATIRPRLSQQISRRPSGRPRPRSPLHHCPLASHRHPRTFDGHLNTRLGYSSRSLVLMGHGDSRRR